VRWTRELEFTMYGGVAHVESKFLYNTPFDPVIVALLGVTSSQQIVHQISTLPNGGARISRTVSKGILYATGGYGVTPGNGLFLTSYALRGQVGYTYTGVRFWSFTAGAGADRSEATGSLSGHYQTVTSEVSASRQFGRTIHLVAQAHMGRYSSPDYVAYNRSIYDIRVGIGFSPGNLPFRLW
jgi:hypothetical protein